MLTELLITVFVTAVLVANLYAWMRRRTSNACSRVDYAYALVTFTLILLVSLGVVAKLVGSRVPLGVVALALFVGALIAAEGVRFARGAHMVPASVPLWQTHIEYWPAYIVKPRSIAVQNTAVFSFRLIHAWLDIDLAKLHFPDPGAEAKRVLDLGGVAPSKQKDLLSAHTMSVNLQSYPERAIVRSGDFLDSNTSITIECRAPDFVPETQRHTVSIASLEKSPIAVALTPKTSGTKSIIFNILDSKEQIAGTITVSAQVKDKTTVAGNVSPVMLLVATTIGIVNSVLILLQQLGLLGK